MDSTEKPAPEPQGLEEVSVGAGIDFTDPGSPLAPYYLQGSHLVAILLLVLIFLFFSLFAPLGHTDFWAHLKFGTLIVHNFSANNTPAFPAHEPFSPFSDQNTPLIHFQWISQVIYAFCFQLGQSMAPADSPLQQLAAGIDIVRTWHALIVTLKCLFLLLAFWRLSGSLGLASFGLVFVLFFSLAPTAIQRPQAHGELCFAILLWTVSQTPVSKKAIFGIPVLLALWANLHGSFLMGFGLLGAVWLGRGLDVLRSESFRGLASDLGFRRLFLGLLLGVFAAAVLNPEGPDLFLKVLALSKNPNIATMDEWQPLNFALAEGGHRGYLMLLLFLLVSQILSRQTLSPGQLLLVFVFGLGPLFQQRLMTWWVMLLPWLLSPLWKDILDRTLPPWARVETVLSLRKTLLGIALVAIGLVWSTPFHMLLGNFPKRLAVSASTLVDLGQALNPTWRPEGWPLLTEALDDRPLTGRIYSSEVLSDYLLWSGANDRVLVYSHVQLFPKDHWADYMTVLFARPGWQQILEREQVQLVAIEAEQHHELAEGLRKSPHWRVFVDETGSAQKKKSDRLLFAVRKEKI